MFHKKTERGQALILITFAAIGLFAFAALAIDGSRAFSNKRHAQNAADTAALAAALAHLRCTPAPCDAAARSAAAEAAALARADSNGYDNNGTTNEVHVYNPPIDGPYAGNSEYIQVKIVSSIPATFARVIGRQTLTSAVEAVTRVQGTGTSSSSYPTDALVALRETDCGICSGGNLNLHVLGSGVFSNSPDNDCKPNGSMDLDGNGTYESALDLDGNGTYESAGSFTNPAGAAGVCINKVTTTLIGSPKVGAPIKSFDPKIEAPSFSCSTDIPSGFDPDKDAPVDTDGAIVLPAGHYSANLKLESTSTYKLVNGNYCLDNGLTIKGGANIKISNVNVRLNGGQFDAGGGSGTGTFECNSLFVYGVAGSDGVHFSGNGRVTCTGVTFYMEDGGVTWNGNSNSDLTAPTGGTYKGLLMYLPASNVDVVKINGTSNNKLVGSIIAPGSEVTISGNSGSNGYDTQIIASYITLRGNSNTTIKFNPANQYVPPPGDSSIEQAQ